MNAILGPQEASARAETDRQVAAIRGVSGAAQEMMRGIAPRTAQVYKDATGEIGGLGAGLAGQLRTDQQAQAHEASDFAAKQGLGPVSTGPDVANTVVYGGAVIPGSDLASQGAAVTAAQEALPASEAMHETSLVNDAVVKGTQAIKELEAQRPDLHEKILDALHAYEMDKLKARIQIEAQQVVSSQFGEKVHHDRATEAAANRRNTISSRRNDISYQSMVNRHQEAMARAAAKGQAPSSALSKVYGYIVDANGRPILDKNGKRIKVAQTGTSGKGVGSKTYGSAVGLADQLLRRNAPSTDKFGDPVPPKNPISKRKALNLIMNRWGVSRATAVRAMEAAGWHFYKPPKV